MTKSISKKILIFLLCAFTVVCVSLFAYNGLSVYAANEYQNTYGSQSVDNATDAESRRDELLGYVEQYKLSLKDKIAVGSDSYWVFDVQSGIEDEAVTKVVDKLDYDISKGNWENVNKSLFGDEGLNGILGIYQTVYNFYANNVVIASGSNYCQVAIDNGLTKYTAEALVAQATEYLSNVHVQDFAQNGYKVADAESWVDKFATEKLTVLVEESENQKLELQEYEAQIEYYRSFYFSDRYDRSYVNQVVYESKTNVDEEKAQEVVEELRVIFATATSFSEAKSLMAKRVDDYVKQVAVRTVLERACEDIENRSSLNAQNYLKPSKVIEACETAFAHHESLGVIEHYKLDGENNPILIDLKTGKPVGDETDMGDTAVLSRVLVKYKEALKTVINDEKQKILDANDYGVSASSKISDYVKYAKVMVDALGKYGRLPEQNAENVPEIDGYKVTQYTYESVTVVDGSDIVQAFIDSFTKDGTLVLTFNGEKITSKKLDEYRLQHSLVYEKINDEGKVIYTVTLTSVNKAGEPVGYFDSEAVLTVDEGASAAVERNIFLILNGTKYKKGTANLTDEEKELLKDMVFFGYYTLTVSAPKYAGGKLDVVEMSKAIRVQVTFEFQDNELLEKIKEKVCAFSYNHTEINSVYSDVTWGDTTMKFTISDFANQAQFAFASEGENPIDWLLLGAIALGSLIVLSLLVFIIWRICVAIDKNRKFKIFFNACGGRYNTSIKVKLHEKFNHPIAPVKPGYVFLGWYLDLACTIKFAMTELTRKGNVKVYAKWMDEEEYNELNRAYENAVKPEIAPAPEVIPTPAPEVIEEVVVEETAPEVVEEVVEEVVVEETQPNAVDFETAIEKAKAETEEKFRQEIEKLESKIKALEEAKAVAPVEEKPSFDTAKAFDTLKAEVTTYTDADDLGLGLEEKVDACAIKVVGNNVELEVNLDLEDCLKKGYKVVKGTNLAVKFVVACDCDMDEAVELIEETMFVNGLEKTSDAVVAESTEDERANGFEYGVTKAKVADTVEEFYKLIRVYAQSFVLADDGDVEEKALLKMFVARGKIYAYLNYEAEGLNACDVVMATAGYKSFVTVKNAEDCKKALAFVGAMMKESGLVRFPSKVEMAGADCTEGFTYTLKK